MEVLHKNSQRPQQVDYICKKGPIADVWLGSKGAPRLGDVNFIVFSFGGPGAPLFSNI